MTRYHHAAYTLDKEIPDVDEAAPSAGHDQEAAEAVKEASDGFIEGRAEQAERDSQAAQEWAERDPKPTPSQLEIERGLVPAPEDHESQTAQSGESAQSQSADENEVPDGSIDDVLAWVGDDQQRAQHALDAEQCKDSPRTTLVAELEKRAAA